MMIEDDFPPKSKLATSCRVAGQRHRTCAITMTSQPNLMLTHDHASRVHRFARTPSLPGFPFLLSCFVNLFHPQTAINLSLFVFVQRWRSTCDGEPGAILSFTLQSTGLLAAAPVVSFLWTAGSAVWLVDGAPGKESPKRTGEVQRRFWLVLRIFGVGINLGFPDTELWRECGARSGR